MLIVLRGMAHPFFVCAISTEGAPPLRFLQGWVSRTVLGSDKLDTPGSWSPPCENHEGWGSTVVIIRRVGKRAPQGLKPEVERGSYRSAESAAPPKSDTPKSEPPKTSVVIEPRSMMLQVRGSHPSKTTKGGAPSLGIVQRLDQAVPQGLKPEGKEGFIAALKALRHPKASQRPKASAQKPAPKSQHPKASAQKPAPKLEFFRCL
jgi:hypothetical protein